MSGRGLLANPGLFAGYDRTPIDAVSVRHLASRHLRGKYSIYTMTELCAAEYEVWCPPVPALSPALGIYA